MGRRVLAVLLSCTLLSSAANVGVLAGDEVASGSYETAELSYSGLAEASVPGAESADAFSTGSGDSRDASGSVGAGTVLPENIAGAPVSVAVETGTQPDIPDANAEMPSAQDSSAASGIESQAEDGSDVLTDGIEAVPEDGTDNAADGIETQPENGTDAAADSIADETAAEAGEDAAANDETAETSPQLIYEGDGYTVTAVSGSRREAGEGYAAGTVLDADEVTDSDQQREEYEARLSAAQNALQNAFGETETLKSARFFHLTLTDADGSETIFPDSVITIVFHNEEGPETADNDSVRILAADTDSGNTESIVLDKKKAQIEEKRMSGRLESVSFEVTGQLDEFGIAVTEEKAEEEAEEVISAEDAGGAPDDGQAAPLIRRAGESAASAGSLPDAYGDQVSKISVTKNWADGTEAADSVTAEVSSSDGTDAKTVTLNQENGWTSDVTADAGKTYSVTETAVTKNGEDVTESYTSRVSSGEASEETGRGIVASKQTANGATYSFTSQSTYAFVYQSGGKTYALGVDDSGNVAGLEVGGEIPSKARWQVAYYGTDGDNACLYTLRNINVIGSNYLYESYGSYSLTSSRYSAGTFRMDSDGSIYRSTRSGSSRYMIAADGSTISGTTSSPGFAVFTPYRIGSGTVTTTTTPWTITNMRKDSGENPPAPPAPGTSGGGLVLEKTADGDYNNYSLSLSAYATASQVRKVVGGTNSAIVLALDISSSMDSGKMARLNSAVQNFVSQMPDGTSVGIVTFADSASKGQSYSKEQAGSISFSADAESTGTNMKAGLSSAKAYLDTMSGDSKNIILFSDGLPESVSGETTSYDAEANAINTATSIKKAGVKIYAISVNDDADASAEVKTSGYSEWDTLFSGFKKVNTIMQLISSNYTGASADGSAGTGVTVTGAEVKSSSDPNSYYAASANATDYSGLFSTVQQEIISYETLNLNSASYLKDFAEDGFDFTDATVTAAVCDYDSGSWAKTDTSVSGTGIGESTENGLTLNVTAGGFTVTGFDYASHWLSGTMEAPAGAQKLAVTVTGYRYTGVRTDADQTKNTNKDTSGVYETGSSASPAEVFPVPSVTVPAQGGITPVDTNSYGSRLKYGDSWQMVSNRFDGNTGDSKTTDRTGNIALQKNVVPVWDSDGKLRENEFLVYLSVDRIIDAQTYFSISDKTHIRTSNRDAKGTVTNSMAGSDRKSGTGKSARFVFEDTRLPAGRQTLATFTKTWANGSNSSAYTQLPDGRYISWGNGIAGSGSETITIDMNTLSEADAIAFYEGLFGLNTLISVRDTLDSHFTYEGIYSGSDGTEYRDGTVSASSGTSTVLSWTISDASNDYTKTRQKYSRLTSSADKLSFLRGLVSQAGSDGKIRLQNDAELVYRVRFAPTEGSLNSAGRLDVIADTTAADNTAAGETDVNQRAVLTYRYDSSSDTSTAVFPVPEVRGMLYDIRFEKTDDAGTALPGASFSITKNAGFDAGGFRTKTAFSGEGGEVAFTDLTFGTYEVTETAAPDGYRLGEAKTWTFTIPENAPDDGSVALHPDAAPNADRALWNTQNSGYSASDPMKVVNAKIDVPLTGVRYPDTEKDILLAVLALGIVFAGGRYLRRRRRYR